MNCAIITGNPSSLSVQPHFFALCSEFSITKYNTCDCPTALQTVRKAMTHIYYGTENEELRLSLWAVQAGSSFSVPKSAITLLKSSPYSRTLINSLP